MALTTTKPAQRTTPKEVVLIAGTALALSACAPPPGGAAPPPAPGATTNQHRPGPDPSSSDRGQSTTSNTTRTNDSDEDPGADGGTCRTSQLDAKLYPQGPGVRGPNGTTGALRVANIGSAPCTINGWGEVEPDGEKGSLPTTVAHNRGMDDPEEHTLKPGQGVVKGLIWNNHHISDHCSLPRRLKVFPPGSDEPLVVDWNERNQLCDNGSLETGPFDTEQWPGVHVPGEMADS